MSARGGELAPEEPIFFNPLDPEAHADPYPQYRRLREHAPMLRGPLGYFAGRDEVDLIADLALPLPVTVISELLGLPIEDQAQAREWAEAIAQALDPIVTEEQALRADRAVTELAAYIGGVVAERRRHSGSDLLSRLIGAEDEGGHLSEAELISTVGLLFGAGHETT